MFGAGRSTLKKEPRVEDIRKWFPDFYIKFGQVVFEARNVKKTRLLHIFELKAIPYDSVTLKKRDDYIERFKAFTATLKSDEWGICVLTEPADIEGPLAAAKQQIGRRSAEIDETLTEYIVWVRRLASQHAQEAHFLFWFEYAPDGSASDLDAMMQDFDWQIRQMAAALESVGLRAIQHGAASEGQAYTPQLETNFIAGTLYKMFNPFSSQETPFGARVQTINRVMRALSDDPQAACDQKQYIAPTSLYIPPGNSDYIYLDGGYHSTWYMQSVDKKTAAPVGWLKFLESLGVYATYNLCFSRGNKNKVIDRIPLMNRLTTFASSSNNRDTTREKNDNLSEFRRVLMQDNEDMWYGSLYVTLHGRLYKSLRLLEKTFRARLAETQALKASVVRRRGGDAAGYLATLPLGLTPSAYASKANSIYLTSTMPLALLPVNALVQDRDGIIIGVDNAGMPVRVNTFDTEADYANAHIIILATPGAGKTFLTSKYIFNAYTVYNHMVRMVLPTKAHIDYLRTVKSVGGTFIDFYPGSPACINPHDIHTSDSLGTLTADETALRRPPLTSKLTLLRRLYQIIMPEITSEELDSVTAAYRDIYASIGITDSSESVAAYEKSGKPYPTFSDFIAYTEKHGILKKLSLRLKTIVVDGLAQNLNGQTNIDLSNRFVAFNCDTEQCDEYLPLYYLIAMDICETDAKKDRHDLCFLVFDEVHRFLENNAPGVAEHLANQFRLLRAYGVSVICATQTIDSLSYEKNGRQVGFIQNASTIIVMKEDNPEEARRIQAQCDLTEQDVEYLLNAKRGQALYIKGPVHKRFNVIATDREKTLFNTDPTK